MFLKLKGHQSIHHTVLPEAALCFPLVEVRLLKCCLNLFISDMGENTVILPNGIIWNNDINHKITLFYE